ncbi:MAG: Protein-tyrosine phosphatase [Chloroflexi bacterium AL-W]|nr:Protein-tyrosine phosphatase [Chloroflexi bacterium AL-N1]NOK67328.1 Protein-tyrosine phosphatase [Chloroflexi bacterium AL-N10]NOK75180.1 Protein-tyrosine phosphatase [Chloroflexi bacterium AL-N5]NOK81968.1 Protein-tyrosine phosphatase [Chloroflexi bacterium AL-W]NOK89813.1 Protein-tyrosine phosphatase [Chloroflexi bacterium AL-N15]
MAQSNHKSPVVRKLTPLTLSQRIWRYSTTQWQRVWAINMTQINELLYVGGAFRARQWPIMYAAGVRAVLSLQGEREDTFTGTPPTRTLRLIVQDFYAPSIDQLQQAVIFLQDAHAAQLPTLVHCRAGVGRAPLTASAYLVAQGMSAVDALTYIQNMRPIVGLNARQLERLAEWEQFVAARKLTPHAT